VTRTLSEDGTVALAVPTAASAPAATPLARSPAGPVLVPSAILPEILSALEWDEEPSGAEPAGPTRRRVVFVDDDEALREVLPALLSGLDFEVGAVSWDEGPRQLAGGSPPALLLADAGLDEERARQRIERLRGSYPDGTPIVLFSSADPWTLRERSRSLGLAGFLSKEALGGNLGGAVERLLGQFRFRD
jgi:CheY-like chemotaxis protein